MANTPLGRYGPLVAAIVAAITVGAYLFGALLGGVLGILPVDLAGIKELSLISLGAIFGSTVGMSISTNGLKREVAAVHHRLDEAGMAPSDTHDDSGEV